MALQPGNKKSQEDLIEPRTETELALVKMWEEILNVRPIATRDNFWDLGGHSVLAFQLLTEIRKTFRSDFPIATFLQNPTVEHLANILREGDELSPAFVVLHPHGSRPPFFIGGSNPRYIRLARHLGPHQPSYRLDVYALQEQCLIRGCDPYTQIEAIAEYFIEKIRSVQPVGPYFMGAGCEAGFVVYEIARQLQRQGQEVAMLLLWEVPPSPFSRKKPLYPLFYFAHQMRSLFRHGPGRMLRRLPEKARAARKAPPLSGEADYFQLIESSVSQALRNYVTPSYPGRIILFRAQEQPPGMYYPTEGWDELVAGGTEIHVLPGNHTTYFDKYFLDFAEELKTCLDAHMSSIIP